MKYENYFTLTGKVTTIGPLINEFGEYHYRVTLLVEEQRISENGLLFLYKHELPILLCDEFGLKYRNFFKPGIRVTVEGYLAPAYIEEPVQNENVVIKSHPSEHTVQKEQTSAILRGANLIITGIRFL